MAKFFIDRPIFAWVIALFIIVMGSVAITQLPIAQYPPVAPPSIVVSAAYPGASAQTLENSVLAVIEQEMNGSPGLIYVESVAQANGTGQITLSFQPGTNPDLAQVDVQNRLSRATPRLPQAVTQQGVRVDKARSNFLLMTILSSDDPALTPVALGDYASRNVLPELQRVNGVGQAQLFGTERAMRIWIDPAKLLGLNLSAADVSAAIRAQNAQVPAGEIGSLPNVAGQGIAATVLVDGQLASVAQFGNVLLRANADGSTVRLRDVARIELGGQAYATSARLNGKPSTGIGVQLSTSGNALATAKAVRAKMQELERYFPKGMTWSIPYDSSRFIQTSLRQVTETLLQAVALVFLVMFLFLQDWRYTIIPTIVVPVALLGTFATLLALGFSINVLTMFAMVLVIGIVVDDAIVVVENVERHIELGADPLGNAFPGAGTVPPLDEEPQPLFVAAAGIGLPFGLHRRKGTEHIGVLHFVEDSEHHRLVGHDGLNELRATQRQLKRQKAAVRVSDEVNRSADFLNEALEVRKVLPEVERLPVGPRS